MPNTMLHFLLWTPILHALTMHLTCNHNAFTLYIHAFTTELHCHNLTGTVKGERSSARLAAVHVVTEEEAQSRAFNIQDVVMPLPGCQVQYPAYNDDAEDSENGHQVSTSSDNCCSMCASSITRSKLSVYP